MKMKSIRFLLLISLFLGNFSDNIFAQYLVKAGGLNQDEVLDIASDAAGNSYVTGYFGSTLSFNGGAISIGSSGLSDIFLVKTNNAGQVLWAVKAGGSADERGNAVVVDASGNVYVTGYFQGTATFGSTTLTSAGLQDVFVAKYDNTGTLLWARRAGGTGADISTGLAVDNSGNVVITGEFKNTADFGTVTLTAQAADAFVCKYDASGTVLWAKNGSGADNSRGLDVAVDAAGNVYTIGQFSNDLTFDVLQANNILNAVYLVKFNANGTEQWFRKIGGASSNIGYSIDVDASSNVYLTGDFTGNLVFFPNTGSPLTNPYANRIFLAKYDNAGALLWAKAAGSDSELSSRRVTVGTAGEIYIGGWFRCTFSEYSAAYGEGTFNSVGFKDGFVARYDQAGSRVWARNVGGVRDDYITGIAPAANDKPLISAVFLDDIKIPYKPTYTFEYPIIRDTITIGSNTHCGDNNYNRYLFSKTKGSADFIYGNLIDPTRSLYDYYLRLNAGCDLDQKDVCITNAHYNCPDTIHLCGSGVLIAQSNTTWVGPGFTYSWSNGSTDSLLSVSAGGTYTVTQTSWDGCYVTTDNAVVVIDPLPPVPLITDNVGVNNQAQSPQLVKVCFPDQVLLTGNNMGMPTYQWGGGVPQSTTTTVSGVGNYYVTYTIANQYGCTNENTVQVQILPELPPIDPAIYFFSDFDMNDSVSFCGTGSLQVGFMDQTLNNIINCNLYNIGADITLNQQYMGNYTLCSNTGLALYSFMVDSSGWYHLEIELKQFNLCDTIIFNLSDSIYVDMYDLPTANIELSGPRYLCANDTVFLTAVSDVPFTWSGNYAFMVNPNTVAVTQPGLIQIFATLTDTVTGCQADVFDTLTVSYIIPPIIISNPASGIICPNDSLLLTVTNAQYYDTFNWIGPQGQIGNNTSSFYVSSAGIYYCIATSASGCSQQSNSIEVTQYGTPYLIAFPSNRLCPGGFDTAFVSVVAPPGSVIQWNSPLSGSDTLQYITSPGIFSVNVNSCGVTTTTSIEIVMSDLSVSIIPQGKLLFCEGDSVILSTIDTNAISFLWNHAGDTTDQFVVYQSGSYFVEVTDSFGCKIKSLPINVSVTPDNIPPPEIADTTFCPPASLLLTASGSGMIYWFDSPTSAVLDSGATYQTQQLQTATSYYLQSLSGGCYSEFSSVDLSIANCDNLVIPNVFTPNGDGVNDYITFYIDGTTCFYAEIRNRWGVKVFEAHEANAKWYGKVLNSQAPVVDGTYFYIIEYCPNSGGKKWDKGFITVSGN
jgi:gliding motility-associated-like protein